MAGLGALMIGLGEGATTIATAASARLASESTGALSWLRPGNVPRCRLASHRVAGASDVGPDEGRVT